MTLITGPCSGWRTAAESRARVHPGLFEIHDDALHGALGDAHLAGDLAHPLLGVTGDAHEHVGVVAENRPRGARREGIFRRLSHARGIIRRSHDYLYWNLNTGIIFPVSSGL